MPASTKQSQSDSATAQSSAFRFFRADAAEGMRSAHERGTVRADDAPQHAITDGMKRLGAAGMGNGATARVLYSSPDMHIGYVWFKSDFPLPLHSHDADCFYQIIAGSMRVGTKELGKGDGVLIPAGAPYTVTPGPDGVEFLEFRPTDDYDTRYRGKTDKYWEKLAGVAAAKQDAWESENPPFDLLGVS